MRLLIHDTLATLPVVEPIRQGWVETGDVEVMIDAALTAAMVGPDDVALLPAGELGALSDRVVVVPDFGVIADSEGPISLRVPVRPDEVDRTPIRLLNVGATGEVLARATLRPFFGIEATNWVRDGASDVQAVVVEGEDALLPAEGGFAEDLCRAWFIMTGQATVLHVLVAPPGSDRTTLAPVLAILAATQRLDKRQRRDIRRPVGERLGLSPERMTAFFERLFFALEADDIDSLTKLLARGTPGSPWPTPGPLTVLPFLASADEAAEDDDAGSGLDVADEADPDATDLPEFPDVPLDDEEADDLAADGDDAPRSSGV